jgi:pimeloyl-ACP methyl ester carboxylesterase
MTTIKRLLVLCLVALFAGPALAASVNGLNIHTTVQGKGPTIIFVHGWTCDETSWSRQVAAFAKDYRVVTLDLPGHGRSDAPARASDFSMKLFAAAVEAVRRDVGADRVVLVGHSMGVMVIRQYALEHPEHVAGLVAADGLLDVRPWASLKVPPMTMERRVAGIDGMFVPQTKPALRQEIKTMMLAAPEATAIGANAAMLDPAVQADQRVITAPALSIFASQRTFGLETNTRERVPDWHSVTIPETGHFVMMEKPDAFNALLRDFLEKRAKY